MKRDSISRRVRKGWNSRVLRVINGDSTCIGLAGNIEAQARHGGDGV